GWLKLDVPLALAHQAHQRLRIEGQLQVARRLEALQIVGERDAKVLGCRAGLGWLGPFEEGLEEGHRAARLDGGAQARAPIDRNVDDIGRPGEGLLRFPPEGPLHEADPDRQGREYASLTIAEGILMIQGARRIASNSV